MLKISSSKDHWIFVSDRLPCGLVKIPKLNRKWKKVNKFYEAFFEFDNLETDEKIKIKKFGRSRNMENNFDFYWRDSKGIQMVLNAHPKDEKEIEECVRKNYEVTSQIFKFLQEEIINKKCYKNA